MKKFDLKILTISLNRIDEKLSSTTETSNSNNHQKDFTINGSVETLSEATDEIEVLDEITSSRPRRQAFSASLQATKRIIAPTKPEVASESESDDDAPRRTSARSASSNARQQPKNMIEEEKEARKREVQEDRELEEESEEDEGSDYSDAGYDPDEDSEEVKKSKRKGSPRRKIVLSDLEKAIQEKRDARKQMLENLGLLGSKKDFLNDF